MIGKRVGFHVGPILLKCQPPSIYQMLDLVFKGQAFVDGMPRGIPMVRASCVRIIPLWKRGWVYLPGSYYGHLVGDKGRQEVFVRHWEWGEFWNWLRGKVPHCVGIVSRASRGWSRNLGGLPLDGCLGCMGAELEEFLARAEKLG